MSLKLLQHSKVIRRGVTAARIYGETKEIDYAVRPGGLSFSFVLPSKGGGNTQIHFFLNSGDLRKILVELAEESPELADMFSKATQKAVSALLRKASVEHK